MNLLQDLLVGESTSAVLFLSLIKATLVLTITQLLVSAMPRLSASMRHLLLIAALSTFVIVPIVALVGPKLAVDLPRVSPVAAQPDAAFESEASPQAPAEDSSVSEVVPAGGPASQLSVAQILLATWALVALVLLSRLLRSASRVRGIVRNATAPSSRVMELFEEVRWRLGIDTRVRVLQSERVPVPMAWGVFRGTLLLPSACESWSDEDLRTTLIHELGHLQRFDYLSLTLINLISSLLWFHPQVWTARGRALAEGERACDDLVVRAGERASGYASHLLQVARLMPRRDPLMALLAMSRPSQLEGRMYALLSPTINRTGIGRKLLMSALTLFFAAVVPLSMMQFTLEAAVDTSPETLTLLAPEGPGDFGGTSTWTSGSTGTCADYNMSFGGRDFVRSEELIETGGNRLSVTAARNGGIRMRRSTTGAFTVLACKAAASTRTSTASQALAGINVQERGGEVTVTGPDEGDWVVHLIVGVPDGASIAARAQNGPLSIAGVDATVRAEVTNGPLSLEDSRGTFEVRSVNGPLAINEMSGDIDAAVQNGPLTVNLTDGSWTGGELRVSVQNGPLTVNLPEGYATGVQVNTSGHGPFSCSLPECASIEAPFDHRGPWRPREIQLGSGPTNVFIQAGNGPITISETR